MVCVNDAAPLIRHGFKKMKKLPKISDKSISVKLLPKADTKVIKCEMKIRKSLDIDLN